MNMWNTWLVTIALLASSAIQASVASNEPAEDSTSEFRDHEINSVNDSSQDETIQDDSSIQSDDYPTAQEVWFALKHNEHDPEDGESQNDEAVDTEKASMYGTPYKKRARGSQYSPRYHVCPKRFQQGDDTESGKQHSYPVRAMAYIKGVPHSGVSGSIFFYQNNYDGPVIVDATIKGLPVGPHGIHAHNGTRTGYACELVGTHWNPFDATHGSPQDCERHAGDLGNIMSKPDGYGKTVARLHLRLGRPLTLFGCASVLDRAIVVHTNRDDLGRGRNRQSLVNGNSGTPLGCGIIRQVFGYPE